MEKSINRYTATCLSLIPIGTLLSIQKPPFFLDIVILCVALAMGVVGYFKEQTLTGNKQDDKT